MGDDRDLEDRRYAIEGSNPHEPMLRFVQGLADYDPDTRRHTTGAMRTIGLLVLVVVAAIAGLAFLLQ